MTYMVAGKQYVALASGTDIFSFALFEPVRSSSTPLIERED